MEKENALINLDFDLALGGIDLDLIDTDDYRDLHFIPDPDEEPEFAPLRDERSYRR